MQFFWGGGILTHFNKEGKVIFNMQQLAVTVAKKKTLRYRCMILFDIISFDKAVTVIDKK